MLSFILIAALIYAVFLGAECSSAVRGQKKRFWTYCRLPAAGLALVPLLILAVPQSEEAPASVSGLAAPAAAFLPDPALEEPEAPRKASQEAEPGIHWLIHHFSKVYGVDPLLVLSIIQEESRFNPKAVSHRGAMGLMQINRITARHLGLKDPFDVRENLEGGIRYLQMLLVRHYWNLPLALASYNAGPSTVQRFNGIPPYRETRRYVWRVLRRYKRLRRMNEVFREQARLPSLLARRVLAAANGAPAEKRDASGTF